MIYLYTDPLGHRQETAHRMLYTTAVLCQTCGATMRRVIQPIRVNWGGLYPSQGQLSPAVRDLIDTAAERRDRFQELHERHDRNGVTSYEPGEI